MPVTGSSWTSSMQARMAFAAGSESWVHRAKNSMVIHKHREGEDLKRRETKVGEDEWLLFVSKRTPGVLRKSSVSEKTFPKRQKSNKTAKLPLISLSPGVTIHSLYTFGGLVKNKSPKKYFIVGFIHLQLQWKGKKAKSLPSFLFSQ